MTQTLPPPHSRTSNGDEGKKKIHQPPYLPDIASEDFFSSKSAGLPLVLGEIQDGPEDVALLPASDQLTNRLSFLNKEDSCTSCFLQERALPNW